MEGVLITRGQDLRMRRAHLFEHRAAGQEEDRKDERDERRERP